MSLNSALGNCGFDGATAKVNQVVSPHLLCSPFGAGTLQMFASNMEGWKTAA